MTDDPAATLVADQPPGPGHRAAQRTGFGDTVRFVLRGIGQTLITGGLIVALFVVYEVWITNIFTHAAQVKVHNKLEQQWAHGHDPLLPLPGGSPRPVPLGTGIANLYIPRLGPDYAWTIVEGTDQVDLAKGPGHYVDTALPGEVGNFAVAGHRVGKGEPFLNVDRLRAGDAIIIETGSSWYVYRVKGDRKTGNPDTVTDPDGIPGREIVDPSDSKVLLAVPDHPGAQPTERLMTMTTCHPKFTASQRMIIYSVLDPTMTTAKQHGRKRFPAVINKLYSEVNP